MSSSHILRNCGYVSYQRWRLLSPHSSKQRLRWRLLSPHTPKQRRRYVSKMASSFTTYYETTATSLHIKDGVYFHHILRNNGDVTCQRWRLLTPHTPKQRRRYVSKMASALTTNYETAATLHIKDGVYFHHILRNSGEVTYHRWRLLTPHTPKQRRRYVSKMAPAFTKYPNGDVTCQRWCLLSLLSSKTST